MPATTTILARTPLPGGRQRLELQITGQTGNDITEPIAIPGPCLLTATRAALQGSPSSSGLDLSILTAPTGDPADPRTSLATGLTSVGAALASSRDPVVLPTTSIAVKLGLDAGPDTAHVVLEFAPFV
jgi:hypothetical protein